MSVVKKKRNLLQLAANDCEVFMVSLEIAEKDFLRDAFIRDLPDYAGKTFAQNNTLQGHIDRRSKSIDYQAHVGIYRFQEEKKSPKMRLKITLSPTSTISQAPNDPPYAEEVFQWLHQFISSDANISLHERAEFVFSTIRFQSVFSLPMVLSGPLNSTQHEVFEGAGMTGIVLLPKSDKAGIDAAGQSVIGKSIFVNLTRTIETSVQKLLSIEADLIVLRTVALSTVRPKKRGIK